MALNCKYVCVCVHTHTHNKHTIGPIARTLNRKVKNSFLPKPISFTAELIGILKSYPNTPVAIQSVLSTKM